jgi:exosortase D (VPLPA-CTERM-specific)
MSSKLLLIVSAVLGIAVLGHMYGDSLAYMLGLWANSEDYSHGFFVPLISLFLIWQARHRIAAVEVTYSWWGLLIIAVGLGLYWIGELAALYIVLHVSLWLVLIGLVISAIGIRGVKIIGFPLFYLLACIPLPVFLYANLSSQLQLISSTLGVGFLQFVGVTAFREGNVIDLGPVQLQVVEACSGIRYLLPLTSLALLCAYLYKDKMWKRVLLVLSSFPISILVNGFRIGVIGVLVEWYGQGAAEGFYHLFEGGVLFMASLGLLILEMWLLANISTGGYSESFLNRFTWVASTEPSDGNVRPTESTGASLSVRSAYFCSLALLIPCAFASPAIVSREEFPPSRDPFVDFPMQLSQWQGTTLPLEKQYIDILRFDDYVLADYRVDQGQSVNFYAAYYRTQKKGQSAHSPQSCLPGGGWEITSLSTVDLPSLPADVQPFHINRVLIQKNDQKQIVLYWFKQRDRVLTDEYLVKFYLFWDAISRGRTDGALVRIASLVGPGESEQAVDRRLVDFAGLVEPELRRYIPD